MPALREICMTELDVVRIEALLHDTRLRAPTERPSVDALEDRLDAARVVHQSSIDAHVVTMNSVVVLTDCTSSAETESESETESEELVHAGQP